MTAILTAIQGIELPRIPDPSANTMVLILVMVFFVGLGIILTRPRRK
jgi:hypothetical protein